MNITVDQPSATTAVVSLDGELDGSNYTRLIDTGRQLYASGVRLLVIDCASLTYMSSSGIVALHSLTRVFDGQEPPDAESGWQAIHDIGTDVNEGRTQEHVRLVAPVPEVDRVIERTGLKELIPIHATREEALAG
jgi:anti-anti-sigma regulatory factor